MMLLTAQPIDPVAFSVGPLSVAWYGLIIGTGIVLGYLLANREADRLGMPKEFHQLLDLRRATGRNRGSFAFFLITNLTD